MKIRDQTLINYYVVVPSALRTNLQTAESLEIIFSSFPHICRGVKPVFVFVFVHNFVFVSVFVTLSVTFCLCLRPGSHHPDSPITHSHCCYRSCLRLATGLFLFLHVGLFANMLRWMDFSQASTLRWTNYSFITLQSLYHCFPVPVFLNLKKYIFWLDFCFSVPLVTEVFVHQ